MIDQRRVRFASIDGINREDLPLACEIWQEDLFKAPWVTREAMKLGTHLMRYIRKVAPNALNLREIEAAYSLSIDDVRKALQLMRTFGSIESFICEREDLRVALTLTFQQRLKVLEIKNRFATLSFEAGGNSRPWVVVREFWELDGQIAFGQSPSLRTLEAL